MILFLDDKRDPKDHGFPTAHWAKTAKEAIEIVKTGKVQQISFDHDLGTKLDGNDVAQVIEDLVRQKKIPMPTWRIHSANPPGALEITATMRSAERFHRQSPPTLPTTARLRAAETPKASTPCSTSDSNTGSSAAETSSPAAATPKRNAPQKTDPMSKETKHLLYWWAVWLKRFLLTSYHLVNRRAYRSWKRNKGCHRSSFNESASRELLPDLDAMEESELH